jgi:hypothetical protein
MQHLVACGVAGTDNQRSARHRDQPQGRRHRRVAHSEGGSTDVLAAYKGAGLGPNPDTHALRQLQQLLPKGDQATADRAASDRGNSQESDAADQAAC